MFSFFLTYQRCRPLFFIFRLEIVAGESQVRGGKKSSTAYSKHLLAAPTHPHPPNCT